MCDSKEIESIKSFFELKNIKYIFFYPYDFSIHI
jgi:hypothetical protein